MGRFLSQKDMSAARREMEVFNSRVNRGEVNKSDIARIRHIVCGCGATGCIFIHLTKPDGNTQAF